MPEPSEVSYHPSTETDTLPSLQKIFDCIRATRAHNPATVTFHCKGEFVGSDAEFVTIQVAPTAIRVGFPRGAEDPDYEIEGWLVGDYPRQMWIAGHLRIALSGEPDECTLWHIEEGKEQGVQLRLNEAYRAEYQDQP